jgi:2-keto-4-pentenoate hydratase/2-oxohepta-3-ene-1,7-dioic acid hydratase in catechol pathway
MRHQCANGEEPAGPASKVRRVRLFMFDDHRLGVLTGKDRIADVTALVGEQARPGDRMTALIADWPRIAADVAAAAAGPGERDLTDAKVRAPQPRPSKIVAAPVNYRLHQQEMGGDGGVYDGATIHDIESYAGFIKAPSSIVGPDRSIEIPFADRRVDYEGEVGVVIGRRASRVPQSEALEYVFGFVPLLDITLRGPEDRSYRKSFDTFTPIGPAIVTRDAAPDPGAIELELTVNGETRQRASTRDLIYDIPRLIAFYSAAFTLEPGDIIATGTPEGVGPIEPGDEIVLTIDGVGRLEMSVTARESARG